MLKYFDKYPDVELVPEPVAQWCDVKGHNLLGIIGHRINIQLYLQSLFGIPMCTA
jgi:hypothetical protein